MRRSISQLGLASMLLMAAASASAAGFPAFPVTRCAADAVRAGTICLDKYEAAYGASPTRPRRTRAW
jgi:hypothetical protein